MTFSDLRLQNITTDVLFAWQASVDILNDYQKFLDGENILNDGDKIFCKCSEDDTFGTNCEYIQNTFKRKTMKDIVDDFFKNERDEISETCYRGPLASQCPNKQCLDWRHICSGYYDCELGEDEKSCLALEANTCRDDEYRCTNGL
jgi:hypothetical protein